MTITDSATDDLSGVVNMAVSNDGAHWATYRYATSFSWDLTNGTYGGFRTDGAKSVSMKWQDGAGNWSAPVARSVLLESVDRWWGPNRDATAVAVSQANFGPGVPVVFIATDRNFPDALAGGPVAARLGGPVLLVTSVIPSVTATELSRLKPRRIVILGGTGVVSATIASALWSYLGR